MIFMLKKWKETGSKQEFILQKFKPGLEMAVAKVRNYIIQNTCSN